MHSGCLWEDQFPYSGEGSVFPAAGKAPFSPRCKERRGKYGKIPFPVKGTAIAIDAVKTAGMACLYFVSCCTSRCLYILCGQGI